MLRCHHLDLGIVLPALLLCSVIFGASEVKIRGGVVQLDILDHTCCSMNQSSKDFSGFLLRRLQHRFLHSGIFIWKRLSLVHVFTPYIEQCKTVGWNLREL